MRRVRSLLAAAALAALPGAALAARDVFLSYAQLRVPTATQVNGFAADQTNRVWVATNQGLPALLGDVLAPFFPLNEISDGLRANAVQAVAFGPLRINEAGVEHFFLGFGSGAAGIQYGRVLATTGLSPRPAPVLLRNDEKEDRVHALAADGVSSLWAGTDGGLVAWEIGEAVSPPRRVARTYRSSDAVKVLAVAPWGRGTVGDPRDPAVAFVAKNDAETNSRLYVTRSGDLAAVLVGSATFDPLARLAFEPSAPATDAGLWVASGRDVGRYAGDVLRTDPGGVPPLATVRVPGDVTINDLAVDPVSGAIWVATSQGAYFQVPTGTPPTLVAGDCTGQADGCQGWRRLGLVLSGENVRRVFVDPSGNLWLGTQRGVHVRLLRLLTISSGRFVGEGTRATVNLEDSSLAGNGGAPDEVSIQVVKVVGTEDGDVVLTLDAVEVDDTGRFTATFGFSSLAGGPGVLKVSPDEKFRVVYRFTVNGSVLNVRGSEFSWSDEKPFEDDLWIGGGCFLKALGRLAP